MPWVFSDAFYSTPGAMEQLINLIENQPFPPTPHGLYHQSRAILSSDTSDHLADIHCPTLVVVGKEDVLTPIKFSQQLAQGIPKAELAILEHGGHAFVVESADAVVQSNARFSGEAQTPSTINSSVVHSGTRRMKFL